MKIELLEGIKGKQVELLLIATGNAGALWARGAALGEQVGQIMVEDAVVLLGFIGFCTALTNSHFLWVFDRLDSFSVQCGQVTR